jgi:tetratricopeptide (TPR) repeat protein
MNIDKALLSAVSHFKTGNISKAEDICKRIIDKKSNNIRAIHLLGEIYYSLKKYDLARKYLMKELELNHANADSFFRLGFILQGTGEFEDSIRFYQKALTLNPNMVDAYNNLGSIFQQSKGQLDKAISYYEMALSMDPKHAGACYNLGSAFHKKEDLNKAVSYYLKSIQINPKHAPSHFNLGSAFFEKGELSEAKIYFMKTLQLDPGNARAYSNLGIVFQESGQLEEAMLENQRALKANPHLLEAHFNIATINLLQGNFAEGWKGLEYYRTINKSKFPPVSSQSLWDGSDISGKTILLFEESGFGDTIQFVRYSSMAANTGAQVILVCHKELKPLLQNMNPSHPVFSFDESLPHFHFHCPLLRLPLLFKTNLDNIPHEIPYFHIPLELQQQWNKKLMGNRQGLKVGLAWGGNPRLKRNRYRSCPLTDFIPLFRLPDITFFSLQKGPAAEQINNQPEIIHIIDYTEEMHDFSDTAAFILNLDLIISVDTAVAHLAGALGKPVWTLLQYAPEWRWMLDREDSPWYPTMRLFRQTEPGDWNSVMRRVTDDLKALLQ